MNFSDAIARGQVFTVRFFHLLFVGNVFIRGVTHQKKKKSHDKSRIELAKLRP